MTQMQPLQPIFYLLTYECFIVYNSFFFFCSPNNEVDGVRDSGGSTLLLLRHKLIKKSTNILSIEIK
jgi:hypothetical protein